MDNTGFGLEHLELGDMDHYPPETIRYANDAFNYWVENDWEGARESMRAAAERRHDYCMSNYGSILLADVRKAKDVPVDENVLLRILDFKFAAAVIGVEDAVEFVMDISMKKCNVLLSQIPTIMIYHWVRGDYGEIENYPEQIKDLLKIFIEPLRLLLQNK
jgi:hypothetical protein